MASSPRGGQAALEYLTTYGWAILAVLVAIGALAYFGIFGPGRAIPSACELEPGILCRDYALGADRLSFVFHNVFGEDLADVTVAVTTDDGRCAGNMTIGSLPDQSSTPVLDFCAGTSFAARERGDLLVTYRFPDETVTHELRGTFALHREG